MCISVYLGGHITQTVTISSTKIHYEHIYASSNDERETFWDLSLLRPNEVTNCVSSAIIDKYCLN